MIKKRLDLTQIIKKLVYKVAYIILNPYKRDDWSGGGWGEGRIWVGVRGKRRMGCG